jgi:hypothetical protein
VRTASRAHPIPAAGPTPGRSPPGPGSVGRCAYPARTPPTTLTRRSAVRLGSRAAHTRLRTTPVAARPGTCPPGCLRSKPAGRAQRCRSLSCAWVIERIRPRNGGAGPEVPLRVTREKRRISLTLGRGELGRSDRTGNVPGTAEHLRSHLVNPSRPQVDLERLPPHDPDHLGSHQPRTIGRQPRYRTTRCSTQDHEIVPSVSGSAVTVRASDAIGLTRRVQRGRIRGRQVLPKRAW